MATTPIGTTYDVLSEVITPHKLLDRAVHWQIPDYQRRQAWNENLMTQWLADISDHTDQFSDGHVSDVEV